MLIATSVGQLFAASAQAQCGGGSFCSSGLPTVGASSGNLNTLLQVFFGVLAAIAVLMIVISGLRFITAQGNPQDMAKARQAIIYSVAGLTVALVAEAIVAFVLRKLP